MTVFFCACQGYLHPSASISVPPYPWHVPFSCYCLQWYYLFYCIFLLPSYHPWYQHGRTFSLPLTPLPSPHALYCAPSPFLLPHCCNPFDPFSDAFPPFFCDYHFLFHLS